MSAKPLFLMSTSVVCLVMGSASAADTSTFTYDELGRLIGASIGKPTGSVNTNISYDPAGNRMGYQVADGSTPTPTPTPTPNQPPTAVSDSFSLPCNSSGSKNLTANDVDPENNVPLTLTNIVLSSDPNYTGTEVSLLDSSSVSVLAGGKGVAKLTYTVTDSIGATSTGELTVTATGSIRYCGGGGTNELMESDWQSV